MSRKPKFKPQVTRIKLNPEQAVLSCNCYLHNKAYDYSTIVYSTLQSGYLFHATICYAVGTKVPAWDQGTCDPAGSLAAEFKTVDNIANS